AAVFRVLNAKSGSAASLGKFHKINRRKIHAKFRVAKKDHLFPLDLAQDIVLDYYNDDRELVFHRSHKFRHQHAKPAIADKSNALAVRVSDLRGYRVRQ